MLLVGSESVECLCEKTAADVMWVRLYSLNDALLGLQPEFTVVHPDVGEVDTQ